MLDEQGVYLMCLEKMGKERKYELKLTLTVLSHSCNTLAGTQVLLELTSVVPSVGLGSTYNVV